jgi:hypothetical protein
MVAGRDTRYEDHITAFHIMNVISFLHVEEGTNELRRISRMSLGKQALERLASGLDAILPCDVPDATKVELVNLLVAGKVVAPDAVVAKVRGRPLLFALFASVKQAVTRQLVAEILEHSFSAAAAVFLLKVFEYHGSEIFDNPAEFLVRCVDVWSGDVFELFCSLAGLFPNREILVEVLNANAARFPIGHLCEMWAICGTSSDLMENVTEITERLVTECDSVLIVPALMRYKFLTLENWDLLFEFAPIDSLFCIYFKEFSTRQQIVASKERIIESQNCELMRRAFHMTNDQEFLVRAAAIDGDIAQISKEALKTIGDYFDIVALDPIPNEFIRKVVGFPGTRQAAIEKLKFADIPEDVLLAIDRPALLQLIPTVNLSAESLFRVLDETAIFAAYRRLSELDYPFPTEFLSRFVFRLKNEGEVISFIRDHPEIDFLEAFASAEFPLLHRSPGVLSAIAEASRRPSTLVSLMKSTNISRLNGVDCNFECVFRLVAEALDSFNDVENEELLNLLVSILYLEEKQNQFARQLPGNLADAGDVFEFILKHFSPELMKRFTVRHCREGNVNSSVCLKVTGARTFQEDVALSVIPLNSPDFVCFRLPRFSQELTATLAFGDSQYVFVGGIDNQRTFQREPTSRMVLVLFRKKSVVVDGFLKAKLYGLSLDLAICGCFRRFNVSIKDWPLNNDLFEMAGLLFEKFNVLSIVEQLSDNPDFATYFFSHFSGFLRGQLPKVIEECAQACPDALALLSKHLNNPATAANSFLLIQSLDLPFETLAETVRIVLKSGVAIPELNDIIRKLYEKPDATASLICEFPQFTQSFCDDVTFARSFSDANAQVQKQLISSADGNFLLAVLKLTTDPLFVLGAIGRLSDDPDYEELFLAIPATDAIRENLDWVFPSLRSTERIRRHSFSLLCALFQRISPALSFQLQKSLKETCNLEALVEIVAFVRSFEDAGKDFHYGHALLENILDRDGEPKILDMVLQFPPIPFHFMDRYFDKFTARRESPTRILPLLFAAHRTGVPRQRIDVFRALVESFVRSWTQQERRFFMERLASLMTAERFRDEWLALLMIIPVGSDIVLGCLERVVGLAGDNVTVWVLLPLTLPSHDLAAFERGLVLSCRGLRNIPRAVQLNENEDMFLRGCQTKCLPRVPGCFLTSPPRVRALILKWLRRVALFLTPVLVKIGDWMARKAFGCEVTREWAKFVTEIARERIANPRLVNPHNFSAAVSGVFEYFKSCLLCESIELRVIDRYLMFYIAAAGCKGLPLNPFPLAFRILRRLRGWGDVALLKRFFRALLDKAPESFDPEEVRGFIMGLRTGDKELHNKTELLWEIADATGEMFAEVCTQETFAVLEMLDEIGTDDVVSAVFDMFLERLSGN